MTLVIVDAIAGLLMGTALVLLVEEFLPRDWKDRS